jgi:pimeloyl-ACP methyl ester carboxylesterase
MLNETSIFRKINLLIFLISCGLLALLVGSNILRMQKESKDGPLFVEVKGQGENVVFLHGILGSHRYWDGVVPELSQTHKMVMLDLYGFGKSPKPKVEYTVGEHIQKIDQAINSAIGANQKFSLVGHSMGAILALNYTIAHPDQVRQLILINAPMVTDEKDLKKAISNSSSKLMTIMTFDKTWGKLVCKIHEMFPFISYPLIRLFEPELPPAVAEAAGQHVWESYSGSFQHVLLEQDFYALLAQVKNIPILIIASDNDPYTKPSALAELPKREGLKYVLISGTHNVLLSDPKRISKEILEFIN